MGNNQDAGFNKSEIAIQTQPTLNTQGNSPPLWTQQSTYFMNSSSLLSSNSPHSYSGSFPGSINPTIKSEYPHWANQQIIVPPTLAPSAIIQSNIPVNVVQHVENVKTQIVGKKRQREEEDDELDADFEDFNSCSTHTTVLEGRSFSDVDQIALSLNDESDGDGQKPSEDGFRWRKYGRKSVKGSKYPRSYYKCTYPGCQVKKQVEVIMKNELPTITTTYKGNHGHERPQVTNVRATDQQMFKNVVLDGFAKQFTAIATNSIVPANMPRLVVETSKSVNHLDDGYRWRKYGQKLVKGSKWPRSYYKCSEVDCMVKKQVDQLEDTIINIYEGTHNHHPPSADGNRRKRRKSLPPAAPAEATTTKTGRRKASTGGDSASARRQSLAAPSSIIQQGYNNHQDVSRRASLNTSGEAIHDTYESVRRQSLGGTLLHVDTPRTRSRDYNSEHSEAMAREQQFLAMQNRGIPNQEVPNGVTPHANIYYHQNEMQHPSQNPYHNHPPQLQLTHISHQQQQRILHNQHIQNQQSMQGHQLALTHENNASAPNLNSSFTAPSGLGLSQINFSCPDLGTSNSGWNNDNAMTLAPAITGNPLNFSGGAFAYVDSSSGNQSHEWSDNNGSTTQWLSKENYVPSATGGLNGSAIVRYGEVKAESGINGSGNFTCKSEELWTELPVDYYNASS